MPIMQGGELEYYLEAFRRARLDEVLPQTLIRPNVRQFQ
jgi:hypothetical protein